jgi:hypothetical protein
MKLTGSGFRKSLSQICVCDATFIIQNEIFYQLKWNKKVQSRLNQSYDDNDKMTKDSLIHPVW